MLDTQTLRRRELTRLSVRRTMLFVLLGELIFIILNAGVLNPLYTYFSADTLYQDAWWLNLIGLLIDISEYIPFILLYPASIYALWRGGWRQGYPVFLLSAGMTICKFIANYAVDTYVQQGGLPSVELLLDDAALILPSLALEMAQYAIILGLASLQFKLYRDRQSYATAEAALRQKPYAPPAVLPMTRMLDLRNPVQRSLFDMAVAVTVLSLLLRRLTYQLVLYNYYGVTDGALQITVDILEDVLMGIVLYVLGVLVIDHLVARDMKRTGRTED